MKKIYTRGRILTTDKVVKIALFSALSGFLMIFKFPLPISPSFMTVDLSDVATLASAFVLGPVSGVITVFVKNILSVFIQGTQSFYIGELSNTIVGTIFVLVSSIIYHRNKTKKTAILALITGTISMTVVATLSNYFFIFPFYAKIMAIDLNTFVNFMPPNNYVKTYTDLMIFAVIPFNLIKGAINSFITILVYKHISRILKAMW